MKTSALALALAAAASIASAAGCKSTPPVDELRGHANESFAREEYKRTIAFDTEILRMQPDDYSATIQRGVAYDRLGSLSDAQADYSRAVELSPDAGLPRLYRANLALKTNRLDVASSDLQALQGVELEKHEQVAALCLAGTVAQKRGDVTSALRPYRQAIDLGRGDPDPATSKHYRDALNNASECYYRLGNFDQSASLYTEHVQAKAQAEEPVTEDDWYTLGVLQYLKGDFARAKGSFSKVSPARRKAAAKALNDEGFFSQVASGKK